MDGSTNSKAESVRGILLVFNTHPLVCALFPISSLALLAVCSWTTVALVSSMCRFHKRGLLLSSPVEPGQPRPCAIQEEPQAPPAEPRLLEYVTEDLPASINYLILNTRILAKIGLALVRTFLNLSNQCGLYV